jgi:hypothetical protein
VDEPAPSLDWLMPTASTSAGVGLVFILSGAVILGTAGGDEYCGIGGCVERPDKRDENLGASLLGAGVGFAATGGLGMVGTLDLPRGTERRRSQPLMVTGFSLTSLAAAGLGVGIAQAATYAPGDQLSTTWPWIMASTITAGVGIPMLAVGSTKRTQTEREADRARDAAIRDPNVPKKLYSPGMVAGGSVLTGLGGTSVLGATGLFFADVALGGPSEGASAVAGVAMGVGTVLTAAGIPLIVAGATREIDAEAAPPHYVPELRTSGTGISAAWGWE